MIEDSAVELETMELVEKDEEPGRIHARVEQKLTCVNSREKSSPGSLLLEMGPTIGGRVYHVNDFDFQRLLPALAGHPSNVDQREQVSLLDVFDQRSIVSSKNISKFAA